MNKENTNRHLALELDDIKNDLVQIVNKAVMKGVPCFLLEYITTELNAQVHNIAEEERLAARKQEEQQKAAMKAQEDKVLEQDSN